jgi:uncharacterized membrane protein (DUF373 family)
MATVRPAILFWREQILMSDRVCLSPLFVVAIFLIFDLFHHFAQQQHFSLSGVVDATVVKLQLILFFEQQQEQQDVIICS